MKFCSTCEVYLCKHCLVDFHQDEYPVLLPCVDGANCSTDDSPLRQQRLLRDSTKKSTSLKRVSRPQSEQKQPKSPMSPRGKLTALFRKCAVSVSVVCNSTKRNTTEKSQKRSSRTTPTSACTLLGLLPSKKTSRSLNSPPLSCKNC